MPQTPAMFFNRLQPAGTFDCLQKMDAIIQLEFALAGKEDISSIGFKLAIRSGTPAAVHPQRYTRNGNTTNHL